MLDGPHGPPLWLGRLLLALIPLAFLGLVAWRLAT